METNCILFNQEPSETEKIYSLLPLLQSSDTRLEAMEELSKYKDNPQLAPLLVTTFGCISSLIYEVINIYPYLNPFTITQPQAERICHVFTLLQVVASCPVTQNFFVKSNITFLLYPFLSTNFQSGTCQYLRLNTLGVLASLIRDDSDDVLMYILSTDIFTFLVHTMESNNELAQTVSTYSFLRLISTDRGLSYVTSNQCRLSSSLLVLARIAHCVTKASGTKNNKLLKHIIKCYARLLHDEENTKAVIAKTFPYDLNEEVCSQILKQDSRSIEILHSIISQIKE